MITAEQIKTYWGNNYRSETRKKAENIRKELIVHSQKVKPEEILKRFRPNEAPQHLEYRLSAYEPITFGWFHKVLTQFSKIRRAEDWSIRYDETATENPLRDYCEGKFPVFDTVENWLFNYQLKRILDDPNGVILFMPRNIDFVLDTGVLDKNKAFEPYPFYIDSTKIIEYNSELFVYEISQGDRLPNGQISRDNVRRTMYFVDKDEIVKVKAREGANKGEITSQYPFKSEYLPAIQCGGLILSSDESGSETVYDSFIGPAVAFWNEAIEGESDHKVDKALHLHPDRWEYASKKCTAKGCDKGKIPMPLGKEPRDCNKCQGTGYVTNKTPFGTMKINVEKTGPNTTAPIPTPPAGYITRDIASIETTKKLADAKIFDGLSAINLDFIGTVPLNQSGRAKEFDRQEVDAYINSVATHLVENVLRNVYFFSNFWLNIGQPRQQREKLEPKINIPRKFDLVTAEVWQTRVAAYKNDGNNAAALAQAEIKLAEKQYGADSPAFWFIRDSIELDPLYGMTSDEKVNAKMNGGCTENQYIISSQMSNFIRRAAIETKNKFFTLEYGEKVETLEKYAEAIRKSKAVQVTNPAIPEPVK